MCFRCVTVFFFIHNDEGDSFHLDLHEPFVTAYSVEEDSGVFIAFSTLSMLFNPLKVVNSGWQLQVQADATFRVCVEEVGLLGFGVNSLGAKFHLTVVSMIPQSIENKKAYLETWKSVNSSLNLLLRTHIRCPLKGCEACDFLHVIKTQESVEDLFHEDGFKLPVHVASSDNNQAFHNFATQYLGVVPTKCCSHLSGVA